MSNWRKSSHSGHDGGECVEVAALNDHIAVRDSKRPTEPALMLTRNAWQALVDGLKSAGNS